MSNTRRRVIKYATDVLINPAKTIALVFKPMEFVVAGCVIFALAELMHVLAHIKGAWDKYKSGKKSFTWMVAKIGIKVGRLIASLTGAAALSAFAILGSSALATLFAPIYSISFMASSGFSTLHKLRGLFDHCTKLREPSMTDEQYRSKRNGLITRAAVGAVGTGLSVAVILKVTIVMVLIANPITFWVGVGIFTGMALWKVRQTIKEYRNPKHSQNGQAWIDNSRQSSESTARISSNLRANNNSPSSSLLITHSPNVSSAKQLDGIDIEGTAKAISSPSTASPLVTASPSVVVHSTFALRRSKSMSGLSRVAKPISALCRSRSMSRLS